jgi:hypothetical protein
MCGIPVFWLVSCICSQIDTYLSIIIMFTLLLSSMATWMQLLENSIRQMSVSCKTSFGKVAARSNLVLVNHRYHQSNTCKVQLNAQNPINFVQVQGIMSLLRVMFSKRRDPADSAFYLLKSHHTQFNVWIRSKFFCYMTPASTRLPSRRWRAQYTVGGYVDPRVTVSITVLLLWIILNTRYQIASRWGHDTNRTYISKFTSQRGQSS